MTIVALVMAAIVVLWAAWKIVQWLWFRALDFYVRRWERAEHERDAGEAERMAIENARPLVTYFERFDANGEPLEKDSAS